MKYKKISDDPIYLSILNYIREHGEVHPSELSNVYNITRQAVDHRLKNLEKEGYIVKKYISGKVYVSLTDKGMEILTSKIMPKYIRKTEISTPMFYKIEVVIPVVLILTGIGGLLYFSIYMADYPRGVFSLLIWILLGILSYLYLRNRGSRLLTTT
jgi:predicted transcriptional regulator